MNWLTISSVIVYELEEYIQKLKISVFNSSRIAYLVFGFIFFFLSC